MELIAYGKIEVMPQGGYLTTLETNEGTFGGFSSQRNYSLSDAIRHSQAESYCDLCGGELIEHTMVGTDETEMVCRDCQQVYSN